MRFLWMKSAVLASLVAAACAPTAAVAAVSTEYDAKSAVIFAYFGIGNDSNPGASVTEAQFTDHIRELSEGAYHVVPLPEIVGALRDRKDIGDRTVAITFDGLDPSVQAIAAPLLIEKGLPFTVFIPAALPGRDPATTLDWDALRSLAASPLVSFGIQPANYERLVGKGEAEIRRQVNGSIAQVRKELGVSPALFAYPFGEYDATYRKVVAGLGLEAAFGQQSGVASPAEDRFALPRFTMTEHYADLDRFVMAASALPLPVSELSPADPYLSTVTPAIGFTLSKLLVGAAGGLSCFASGDQRPQLEKLGSRVELRLKPFDEEHPRINCTMPAGSDDDPRWRWLGMMFTVPRDRLNGAAARGGQEGEELDAVAD